MVHGNKQEMDFHGMYLRCLREIYQSHLNKELCSTQIETQINILFKYSAVFCVYS